MNKTPTVTDDETRFLRLKRDNARLSDTRIATLLGLSLTAARAMAAALRAKLEPAPGQTMVDRAAELGILGTEH